MSLAMRNVKAGSGAAAKRNERARATRLRITKVAYRLFADRGYAGTEMSDIAREAGVAVQTVYFIFHTKAELLSRAYDLAVLGEDDPRPPEEQPWHAAMAAEPNVAFALRHAVDGIGVILDRATPLDTLIRASAEGDPETSRVRARHERWRAEGYRRMLDILTAKAPLRDGVGTERATQLLLLYIGMDMYRVLVLDFGWTREEWIGWTVATLNEHLFARTEAD